MRAMPERIPPRISHNSLFPIKQLPRADLMTRDGQEENASAQIAIDPGVVIVAHRPQSVKLG